MDRPDTDQIGVRHCQCRSNTLPATLATTTTKSVGSVMSTVTGSAATCFFNNAFNRHRFKRSYTGNIMLRCVV